MLLRHSLNRAPSLARRASQESVNTSYFRNPFLNPRFGPPGEDAGAGAGAGASDAADASRA